MTSDSNVLHRKRGHQLPTIDHGDGVYLWDTTGKRYIDASGGAVVVNIGYGVGGIAEALAKQAKQVAYAHATMFSSVPLEEFARRLANHLAFQDPRIYLATSGAETVETASKLARQVQIGRGESSRYKVISRLGSYHGATLGALAVSGKPSMRSMFAPMFLDMPHIPAPFCYHCPWNLEYPECGIQCALALDAEIAAQGKETVAAFLAEPIGGATLGAVVPPDGYWQRVREICDEEGILFIADEVMTGIGRTGRWFALEHWDVEPDIICIGKGIAGGYFPLGAVALRSPLMQELWEQSGDMNHGSTFSNQPLAAAVGLATLQYLENHNLVARAERLGAELGKKLRDALESHPHVGDIRGMGMLWAVEFVQDRETRMPFPSSTKMAARVFENAFDAGLILYPMSGCVDGTKGDHIMVAPPFVVEPSQLDEIVAALT